MNNSPDTLSSRLRLRSRYFVPLFIMDLVFFGIANPTHAHVWVIMVGGALVVVTVYALCVLCARAFAYLFGISRRGQRLLSGVMTAVGLYTIFMQSIGQLNVRDALALIPLVAVFYFYVTYARKMPQ